MKSGAKTDRNPPDRAFELARVLVVDDELASRLTLQTVLEAGGYSVDVAASAAEAVDKMDEQQYELVLSDLDMESPDAGLKVLAHARLKEYKPATALVTAFHEAKKGADLNTTDQPIFIETEDVQTLLQKVADLIGLRATRRIARALRHATS